MKFLAKCLVIFIVLTALIMLGIKFLLESEMPFAIIFLVSAFFSLMITIFYGWIDDVFISKRQPELD